MVRGVRVVRLRPLALDLLVHLVLDVDLLRLFLLFLLVTEVRDVVVAVVDVLLFLVALQLL